MKKSILLSGLVFLSMTGIAHAAKATNLKVSSSAIELTGTAPQGTKVSVLVVYIPDAANANTPACQFEEDKYSPNGANVIYSADGKQDAQGVYSVKVPLTGLRNTCKYSYNQVYFTIEKAGVYENILLDSDAKVAEENAFADEMGYSRTAFQDIETQKGMYCDFTSDVGLCQIEGTLLDLAYHVSSSEHKVQFDVKDLSELPQ